jgi:hypothetical protein
MGASDKDKPRTNGFVRWWRRLLAWVARGQQKQPVCTS